LDLVRDVSQIPFSKRKNLFKNSVHVLVWVGFIDSVGSKQKKEMVPLGGSTEESDHDEVPRW
jgi:hypothetical protein